jgi:hypothetical protein
VVVIDEAVSLAKMNALVPDFLVLGSHLLSLISRGVVLFPQ